MAQRVLMIGGAMRSGTTVIRRALCAARNYEASFKLARYRPPPIFLPILIACCLP
jgi:hypothetical protein